MVIFAPNAIAVNFADTLASFGFGLFDAPIAQVDNVTRIHPASAADLDEQTAYSIAQTIAEEAASRGVEQEDNVTEYHPADSRSIDEVYGYSITTTAAKAKADHREAILEREAAKSLYFDRYAAIEREAEEAALASRWDSICVA